jgi:hypothetical protein
MKKLLQSLALPLFLILVSISLKAQSTGLEVETVSEDIGVLVGALGATDLTGYSCYQVFVTMTNEDDFLSSVSGDAMNPTYVNTTTDFYNAALGAGVPNGINSLLFPVYPDLAYDSWVTIGLTGMPNALAGEASVSTVQATANPWFTNFDPGGGLAGESIVIDDVIGGTWYALNGDANGVAGTDLKVLAGQFTTTGDLSGQLYTQVFPGGDGSIDFRETYVFGGAGVNGCTDDTACNFNPDATEDVGCLYPEDVFGVTGFDCEGNCECAPFNDDLSTDFQEYGLVLETYAENIGMVGTTDLTGYNTYRLYAKLSSPDDFLTAVYGDANFPTVIQGGNNFFQSAIGGLTNGAYNSIVFPAVPDLEYDSFVTIGMDGPPSTADGEQYINTVGDPTNNWIYSFEPGAGMSGSDLVINTLTGGSWFTLFPNANGFAGEDSLVLIGQFTTDTMLTGFVSIAVFEDGNQQNDTIMTLPIPGAGLLNESCTDPLANNYCGCAVLDNGSCTYDEGCTDAEACNYDPAAVLDDGGCLYPIDFWGSTAFDCEGNCLGQSTNQSSSSGANSNEYGVQVEVVADDIGVLVGALGAVDMTGYSCYRVFVTMVNEDDFMSSVSGDALNPTYVETTTNFYHAALGAGVPNGINSLLFPVYPDLAYDTWVTIGLTGTPNALAGEANVSTVQSADNPWFTNFDPGGGLPGGNISIDDGIGGGWNAWNGDANGVAGDDLKVLAGQFTTTGELSGQVYCQVFINGNGQTEFRDTFFFSSEDVNGGEYAGCTDEAACNWEICALEDDGSCLYPEDVWGSNQYDCEGNCLGNYDEATFDGGSEPGEYGLQVEVVADDIGVLVGALGTTDLSGYTCYRAYITTENEDDFFSSISGDSENPTYVNTTAHFYHAALGAGTPNGINSLLFPVYPDLAYDSWVTIGLEGVPNAAIGEASISTVQATDNPWMTNFDPGGGLPGDNVAIDGMIGGAWYALNGDANGVAGSDLRVLAGQFTTTGDISFQLVTQIFINGIGQNEVEEAGERPTYTWSSLVVGDDVPVGCTDEEACNYLSCALEDDGSCEYPPVEYIDCEGNCLNDGDGDGICDEDEPCSDPTACDYDGSMPTLAPYCLVLDTVAVHGSGALAGMTTYRISIQCANATDFVSAVAGYNDNPTRILTTTEFYQNELGGATPNGVFPLLYPTFPDLEYDSWVTIGLDQAPDVTAGEAAINTVQNTDHPWIADFDPGLGQPGANIIMQDPVGGSWFSLIGDSNGYANTAEQQVLLAQLTTDGVLSGQLFVQVFVEGNGNDIEYLTLDIGGPCYLPDEDCTYPADLYGSDLLDCDGNCVNDTDGDGVCDEEEVPGCTDESACNFDASATDDDGGCSYLQVNVETQPVSCYGEANGTLSLEFNDGLAPYEVTVGEFYADLVEGDSLLLDFLSPGLYTVHVVDAAGCATEFMPIYIAEPELLEYSVFVVDSCISPGGGTVYVEAFGGSSPYTFNVPGESSQIMTSPGIAEFVLAPGEYMFSVSDSSHCTADEISLTLLACTGCTDEAACNFDDLALEDDGSCEYPDEDYLDCEGNCFNDSDGDGVCDEIEVPGCTWLYACNYDPEATDENGTCYLASVFFDCEGNCSLDLNGNGICDFFENLNDGSGFCGEGTVWDVELETCVATDDCPSDVDNDGYVGINDLLDLLADFTTICE